jgi:hypothetical protein
MNWKKVCLLGLLVSISALLPSAVLAGSIPAITITNTTGNNLGNPPFTLGWQFTTNQQISVTNLGIFDDSLNGLADRYQVGIWNSSGTLLGTATVLSGTADPLVNQFRYASLSGGPITLAAGQTFEIGALYLDGNDGLIFPGGATGFASAPFITFDQSSFIAGGTLSDPTSSLGTEPSYFGPNFEAVAAVTATPEPSSLILFGTSILGLIPFRRKLLGR